MKPIVVPALLAFLRRSRLGWVSLQPVLYAVVIELFCPEETCKALLHNFSLFIRKGVCNNFRVKFIMFH